MARIIKKLVIAVFLVGILTFFLIVTPPWKDNIKVMKDSGFQDRDTFHSKNVTSQLQNDWKNTKWSTRLNATDSAPKTVVTLSKNEGTNIFIRVQTLLNHVDNRTEDVISAQPIKHKENEWELEQARRRATLKKTCAQHPDWNMSAQQLSMRSNLLWPLIYDDKYKVIYCTLCKVASTTWKSVFLVLMGKYKSIQDVDLGEWYQLDRSLHTLQKLRDPKEIEKRLRTYKKIIFVREPFSRELSGYRNKLYKRNKYYQKTVGTKIIRQFRRNPDKEALETGVGVTFAEFVKHLTNTKPEALDIHWRPMYKMVLPCAVEYDYIGFLETAEWDNQNILNKTGIGEIVDIPKVSGNLSNSDEIFNRFYKELEPSLVHDMYQTFKFDSELFGYEIPELIEEKLGKMLTK